MTIDNNDWKNFKRDANRVGFWTLGKVLLIILIALVVGALIWGANVLLSGPRGQGDAIVQKNSSENFIAAQARFEDLYQEIEASQGNIDIAKNALANDPDDRTLQTNLNGVLAHCNNTVGDYNAEARKFLSEEFRAVDLPPSIDADTTCK